MSWVIAGDYGGVFGLQSPGRVFRDLGRSGGGGGGGGDLLVVLFRSSEDFFFFFSFFFLPFSAGTLTSEKRKSGVLHSRL